MPGKKVTDKRYVVKTLCYSNSSVAALKKIKAQADTIAERLGHRNISESAIVSAALDHYLMNGDFRNLMPH